MKLTSCEFPIRIYNEHLGTYLYVPCRKCASCRINKQLTLTERIDTECRQWKYIYFITLTYDEKNVPKYELFYSTKYPLIQFLIGKNRDSIINVSGINDDIFLDSQSEFNITFKKDVQLFIKRFRRYADYKAKKKGIKEAQKVRYFISSEYGPKSRRPHYHGILFFDSPIIARCCEEILRKSWKHGFVLGKFANRQTSKYVAKYCYSVVNLSPLYQVAPISPWYVSSRKPSIGYVKNISNEVQKYFFGRAINESRTSKGRTTVTPLPPTIESRIFPKFKEFNNLSIADRIRLIRTCLYIDPLKIRRLDREQEFNLKLWLYSNSPITRLSSNFPNIQVNKVNLLQYYNYAINAWKFCKEYGINLENYFTNIVDYYNRKELYLLNEFYRYQEDILNRRLITTQELIHFYPEFRDDILNNKLIDKRLLITLITFHYDTFTSISEQIKPINEVLLYRDLVSTSKSEIKENMRTKHIRDYNN